MPRPAFTWALGGCSRLPARREIGAEGTGLARRCRLGVGARAGAGGLAGGGTGGTPIGLRLGGCVGGGGRRLWWWLAGRWLGPAGAAAAGAAGAGAAEAGPGWSSAGPELSGTRW